MARILAVLFITGIVQVIGESIPKSEPKPKVPGVPDEALQKIVNDMWEEDKQKYPLDDEHVDIGKSAQDNKKPLPKLFQNEWTPARMTNESLTELFQEFDKPIKTAEREQLFDQFLTEIIKTRPMQTVLGYLKQHTNYEPAKNDTAVFEDLKFIWFTPCSERGTMDATAFSHVFIGEMNYRKNKIDGMHNWLRYFYLQNVRGEQLKYFGYHDHHRNFLDIKYMNGAYLNKKTTFFYGTSPEFDMAIYTLCYLTRPGKGACKFHWPSDTKVSIEISTIEKERYKSSSCLFIAFPCIQGKACM